MSRYKKGDVVLVNGNRETIQSWPEDGNGFFVTTYEDKGGSVVQNTHHTGTLDVSSEPVHTSANVEIVEEGAGEVSTLGDIHDVLNEVNHEIEAELDKTQPVIDHANGKPPVDPTLPTA